MPSSEFASKWWRLSSSIAPSSWAWNWIWREGSELMTTMTRVKFPPVYLI